MRVCMITPRYPPDRCGVGDYTALLARHLAAAGISVTVLTSRYVGAMGGASARATPDGVEVRPVIDDWGWRSLPRLLGLLRAGRFDLAHVQYQNEMYHRSASIAALPPALRLMRWGRPVVVTVHDYGTPWPRRLRVRAIAGPYGKAWFAAMLLAATRVILTNEQDEWRFLRQRRRYPAPASRYVTIPVGSNLPLVAAPGNVGRDNPPVAKAPGDEVPADARSDDSPDGAAVTIGYFGFVNPAKGVDTLLDAFALARRDDPRLRLAMVCALRPDDPYHQRIAQLIEQPALRDHVTVTGELDDDAAAHTLAGCDVVALPYRDGVSLRRTTLIAALALGRPVISTRAAVPPAALRDGRDLVLVPPDDAAALAAAIVALAADPAARDALGRSGREAAQAFAWPAIAARTAALYRQVVA